MPQVPLRKAEAITNLVRLSRVQRSLERPERDDVAAVGEYLRELIGPTVRPSEVARLLGVSHAALNRWLASGDIATVLTPGGRREVPLSEVVNLLTELDGLEGAERSGRPLSRVIRARKRRAEDTIDVDRLLPRRRPRGHRLAELRSLAYHRLVAERLDEELVAEASRRVARWRESGRLHPVWAERWSEVLRKPVPDIARTISADTQRSSELRQTSPFAGVLNEQERSRLVRGVQERLGS